MKKNLYIRSILMLAATGWITTVATSCSDFLEQPANSSLNTDMVFSDPDMAMRSLFTVYGSCVVNGFIAGEGGSNLSDTGTSDGLMVSICDEGDQYGGNKAKAFKDGSWGPSNQGEFHLWRALAGCRNASLFIDNVDKVPLVTTKNYEFTAAYREQVRGEAKVLRAMIHFEMMRRFGGIPIMDQTPRVVVKTVDGKTKTEVVPSAKRRSIKSTIDFIVNSCDEAITYLPDSYASSELGRVTKGFALGLKARTLLYAASPLYNNATPPVPTKDGTDSLLCYGQKDDNRWKAAAEANLAAINWAHNNNYELVKDSDVGGRPGEGYAIATSAALDVRNKEIIHFDHSHGEQPGGANIVRWGCPIWYSWGNCVTATPINFVRNFYMKKDGTPLAFPDQGTFANLKDVMRQAEPRLHESVWVYGFPYTHNGVFLQQYGGLDTAKVMYRSGSATGAWKCMGLGSNFNGIGYPNGFHFKKFVNRINARGWIDYYWPIMRLAELYLNYAEALNEWKPGDDDIRIYINKLRSRGGVDEIPEGAAILNDQDAMRKLIQRERAVELYAEEHRVFDVRRWKIASDEGVLKGDFYRIFFHENGTGAYVNPTNTMNPQQRRENDNRLSYKVEKYESRIWDDKMYFYPFPQDEVNKGFLSQNPGWN